MFYAVVLHAGHMGHKTKIKGSNLISISLKNNIRRADLNAMICIISIIFTFDLHFVIGIIEQGI